MAKRGQGFQPRVKERLWPRMRANGNPSSQELLQGWRFEIQIELGGNFPFFVVRFVEDSGFLADCGRRDEAFEGSVPKCEPFDRPPRNCPSFKSGERVATSCSTLASCNSACGSSKFFQAKAVEFPSERWTLQAR